jgi:hypothetical protein
VGFRYAQSVEGVKRQYRPRGRRGDPAVCATLSFATQIPSRRHDCDCADGMQREEIVVAADHDVRPAVDRHFQELIVLGSRDACIRWTISMSSTCGPRLSKSAFRRSRDTYRSNLGDTPWSSIHAGLLMARATDPARSLGRRPSPGVDVLERRPMMKTIVSITTRFRVIVVQEFGEAFIGEAGLRRLCGDLVAQVKKCAHVGRMQTVVVRHREDHGDVSILTSNHDRFLLGGVEDRA